MKFQQKFEVKCFGKALNENTVSHWKVQWKKLGAREPGFLVEGNYSSFIFLFYKFQSGLARILSNPRCLNSKVNKKWSLEKHFRFLN